MAYLSLYRKYRSQSFEEVSGQDHVIRTLQNAIRGDRVAHAYLFCGPRGTGKTSTARLLAKALNCDNGPTPEPCGTCEACVQIAEGRFMDIKEIDAASNRGIDDIRDLRDTVAYAPTHGRHKVYVIDEAHQITGDAFNALLKTLEEPPPYVVFILATTEHHKIPATIVSRCQRFEFRRASMEDLRSRVAYVAEQEGATLDDGALELIAREANGGWRDALSVLEQVLSFCDGSITAKEVYAVLGTVEADSLHALSDCILSADGAEGFRLLEELISEGKDPRQLLRDLTQHFRSLML
ncbi:MAG: DNA polymerase III subunit gamma/tau, partial [Actinomycetota bacterium]